MTAPADGEAAKDAQDAASPAESPAAETPGGVKDKRRSTSFFGTLGINKSRKGGDSGDEGTDGEGKHKSNKLGGLFRKPSKGVKDEVKKETPAEETKPEPVAKDEPAKPAEETTTAEATATEEAKPADATASTAVQAAA